MTSSTPLSVRLYPELELELDKTLKVLTAIPEDAREFRPHERSGTLGRIAGHLVDLLTFMQASLTAPDFDFGTEHRTPLLMSTKVELLAEFKRKAASLLAALQATPDEVFDQPWHLLFNGRIVFTGSRYTAYRINCFDHMLHHRSQLTVYLRLAGALVPSTFGPSADEHY